MIWKKRTYELLAALAGTTVLSTPLDTLDTTVLMVVTPPLTCEVMKSVVDMTLGCGGSGELEVVGVGVGVGVVVGVGVDVGVGVGVGATGVGVVGAGGELDIVGDRKLEINVDELGKESGIVDEVVIT